MVYVEGVIISFTLKGVEYRQVISKDIAKWYKKATGEELSINGKVLFPKNNTISICDFFKMLNNKHI